MHVPNFAENSFGMNKSLSESGPSVSLNDQTLDLGILLGQRRAFTLVASRCSAAHVTVLRKLRDEKRYLAYASSWAKYCGPHLKISRRHCDRIIALLNEFGPVYFELAELVGITAEQYRRIEPSIRENAIHVGAEVIALDPANSAAIAAAVSQILRSPATPNPARNLAEKLARLDTAGRGLAFRFERLLERNRHPRDHERVLEVIRALRIYLGSLDPVEL